MRDDPIATSAPMWRQDTVRTAMPVTCRSWEKALSDARWRAGIRRTQGRAQRQLQAWPLHRRDNGDSSVGEGDDPRSEGADQDASRPAVIACEANPLGAAK
jgi:formylglycine-generating enzyme required for sulfatase activity